MALHFGASEGVRFGFFQEPRTGFFNVEALLKLSLCERKTLNAARIKGTSAGHLCGWGLGVDDREL